MENLISRVKSICDELAGEDGLGGQIALATAADASKSVVNQWLAGKIKSIDINYALAIERNLGYNHIWLMIGKGNRKVGGGGGGNAKGAGEQILVVDEGNSARGKIPKNETPVSADVLEAIGFLSEDESRVVALYRMSTQRGRKMIMATCTAAPKLGLAAVIDDQSKSGPARASDGNSL